MPPTRRLRGAGIEPDGDWIAFDFEGSPVPALPGESLAAALTAAGHMGLRQAGAEDRRGIFCGMGACQECLVEIDGRGGQRACMTKVVAGMDVRRHDPAIQRSPRWPLAPTATRLFRPATSP